MQLFELRNKEQQTTNTLDKESLENAVDFRLISEIWILIFASKGHKCYATNKVCTPGTQKRARKRT